MTNDDGCIVHDGNGVDVVQGGSGFDDDGITGGGRTADSGNADDEVTARDGRPGE